MTAFHDVRFPIEVAFGATGGPQRKTQIVSMASGAEARNTRWAHSKRSFNAGTGIKTLDQLHDVVAFFEERRGALHAFRFRDPLDFKSCHPSGTVGGGDQQIGIGDGSRVTFDLVKWYGTGEHAYARPIRLPVETTLVVEVDGNGVTTQTVGEGTVTLVSPPGNGAVVTAGFEFDVPVRFDTDELSMNLAKFAAGDIPTVPLVEVRL
ncbi:MAG: DUF2460 domain-containing protein [Pseudomonadota bacterium]